MMTMKVLTESVKQKVKEKINQKGKDILLYLLMENKDEKEANAPRIEKPQALK